MNTRTQEAFFEEVAKIKEAGIGSFLGGGLRGLGKVVAGRGVAGAARAGGNMANMKNIWNAGAAKAVKGGGSGFMGGLGALGRSNYGQMAAAAAVPVAAGYGLHKMTS